MIVTLAGCYKFLLLLQTKFFSMSETRYILSTIFVPGDRHVLAGLKNGTLLIIDIAAGDVLEEIPAHSEELWAICLTPDQVKHK